MGRANNKKKNVSNIKGLDKAHPYSRKATQLNRAVVRNINLQEKRKLQSAKHQLIVDKLVSLQTILRGNEALTAHELIQAYIARNDAEIKHLNEKRRNNSKTNRQQLLESLRQKDEQDYSVGFEIPDISDPEMRQTFIQWDQDYNSISILKMQRFVKE
ncbi:translation machinery-associated protein 16 [Gorgonomyces haynaldii]|nr:translation machinery-associated protein 16 [Gorgonomyces haynaldii]